jgi:hypothetical protein
LKFKILDKMTYVDLNQDIVNKYFKNWIGVSIFNTENPNKEPSCFCLDFLDFDSATSSYEFIREWQNWLSELPLILSIVKENRSKYSFYLYKQNRKEFVEATFSENLNTKKLKAFIEEEKSRTFVLLPRYSDENNNIVDSYTTEVIILKGVRYSDRKNIRLNQIEYK